MDKRAIVQQLREFAADANRKASAAIAVDEVADAFYQGRRNAFNEAADLVEREG